MSGDGEVTGTSTGKGIYSLEEGQIAAAEFQTEFQARQPLSVPGSQETPVSVSIHQLCKGRIVREVLKKAE